MGGSNHQDTDDEYISKYDEDFGRIRRSRRLRLQFKQSMQTRMRCINPSDEDGDEGKEEEHERRCFTSRRSKRVKSRLRSYNRGYLNSTVYKNDVQNRSNHKYSLRRLRNRISSSSNRGLSPHLLGDRKSDILNCLDSTGRNTGSSYNSHCSDANGVSGIRTSPRRLRVRTKKINYEERKPTFQLDDKLGAAIDISKTRDSATSPIEYMKPLNQNYRSGNLSYGVGCEGAGIFSREYEEDEIQKPILQYSQCVKQIKFLPKELQEKSREVLHMHLENKDFPELPPLSFSTVSFDDIIGHDEHVHTIKEMLKISLMYPEFSRKGLDISKGILFYGPPGTGKTMTARALASSCSTPDQPVSFFFCNCADIQSKWFGESEKHLKQLFEQAKTSEPSILFFDEIDGLTPTRSSGENAHYNTIVNTLLALMDGLKGRGQVIVIAATNRLDTIDPAFLRPGRFDRILEFDLPNRETRLKMIEVQTKSFKVSEKVVSEISKATQGCNGADVKFLCSAAFFRALRRYYPKIISSKKKIPLNLDNLRLKMTDFSIELAAMRNSSAMDHIIGAESGIELLLSNTWQAIFSLIDVNFKIILNKLQPQMYKMSNYYEPRVLVTGPPHSGQIQLGHCIKRWLVDRGFRVETLAYPSIENIENTIQTLQFSKMRAVIITNLENWAPNQIDPLRHLEICLSEIHTIPVIIVGIESIEDSTNEEVARFFQCKTEFIENLFYLRGVINIQPPTPDSRKNYFSLFIEELKNVIYRSMLRKKSKTPVDRNLDNEDASDCEEASDLADPKSFFSETELQLMDQKFQKVFIELKQRLRGFHRSLSKKHRIFTQPFDSEKYPGYDKIVGRSMDLNTILENVDSNRYFHPDEWMRDIDTIFQNAFIYHTRVKRIQEIMHKAYEFRDYAGALINTISSVSKLNYWQLKMWNTVKDKLFFEARRDVSIANPLEDEVKNEDNQKSSCMQSNCQRSYPSQKHVTPPHTTDNFECYNTDTLYKSPTKNDTVENGVANTPVVKHRRYEIPVDGFSSSDMSYEDNVDPLTSNTTTNPNKTIQPHCGNSIDNNTQNSLYKTSDLHSEDLDKVNVPEVDPQSPEGKKEVIESDSDSYEQIYFVDVEIEERLSVILNRLVNITDRMSVNDIITLSVILWNVIATEESGESFCENLLSSVVDIILKIESTLNINLACK